MRCPSQRAINYDLDVPLLEQQQAGTNGSTRIQYLLAANLKHENDRNKISKLAKEKL